MAVPPIKIGLIGGSGLGEALRVREQGTPRYVDTPFGRPSGPVVETTWHGLTVLALSRHGHGHVFSPTAVPYRANVFALKMLGCTHILASGAVGSLREEYRPRDVVVPEQVIDRTHKRPNTFFENAAVHVELAEPFCPVLRGILRDTAGAAIAARGGPEQMRVHHGGCYVAMEGPAFSTRAESLMHRLWGGDLIGMTAMPEARLAREAELPYALVTLVTDYDCWRQKPAGPAPKQTPDVKAAVASDAIETKAAESDSAKVVQPVLQVPGKHELLNEIIGNLKVASENGVALLRAAVERIAADPAALEACPARHALELAVWSDKSKIPRDEIDRLGPLWGAYFAARG